MRFPLLFFLLVLFKFGYSQDLIYWDRNSSDLQLWDKSYYYLDETGNTTFEEISGKEGNKLFKPCKNVKPNFGINNSSLWIKFSIASSDSIDDKVFLTVFPATLAYLDIYSRSEKGKIECKSSGNASPYSQYDIRKIPAVFQLNVMRSSQVFYLKIKTHNTLRAHLSLNSEKSLVQFLRNHDLVQYLYTGVLLVVFIYNLFIFLRTGIKIYLYYSFYVLCFLIFQSVLNNDLAFQILWSDIPAINSYIYAITCLPILSFIYFSVHFLETSKNLPRFHKVYIGFSAFISVIIIADFAGHKAFAGYFLQMSALVLSFLSVVTGVLCYNKGVKNARLYNMAIGTFLICVIIWVLLLHDQIPHNWVTANILTISSALDAIIFSFGIADKINIAENERKLMEEERAMFIANENQKLELLAQERTKEITEKNKKLEEVFRTIEMQNAIIGSQNKDLEKMINARTNELQRANQELIKNNAQLEQFGYVIAHNFRAPVARIMGLINILEIDHNELKENTIIQNINSSAHLLDNIIKDLILILEVKKGNNKIYQNIDFEEKLTIVMLMLQSEINVSKAQIDFDFSEIRRAYTISAYFENILFNLISNSIKYKNPWNAPEVKIKSRLCNDEILIRVQDNGLGMDVEKNKDKLFGLYKRFHNHVEGKGLGLYLIKSQLMILGGRVEVESREGEGAIFNIYLPNNHK